MEQQQEIDNTINELKLKKEAINIVDKLKDTISDIKSNQENLIVSLPSLVFQIMKLVEMNKMMTGNDKKKLVILVVNEVFEDQFEKNEALKVIINTSLSSMIELAITVSKDKNFNKKLKKCFSCRK